jgi:hypothetical protein
MAEKTGMEKGGHRTPDPRAGAKAADGPLPAIDVETLSHLLNAHAATMATTLAKVMGEKLAELKSELTEREIGRAHEREDEHAWLAKYPPGDREHLKKTDQELRCLEQTLEGPQTLLEREDRDDRPLAKGEASWGLPKYEPVPPDGGD